MHRLLLVFLANFYYFPFSTGEYSIIEVYGFPLTFKSVNENPELNWKQCIQFCWNTPLCVLAYNKKSDGCQWFVHDNITTVKQMKKANGYIVAFKINATSNTCPTGPNPPTFNNKSITGSATLYYWDILYGVRFNYTISLANDRWTFAFNYKFACPSFQFAFVQRANALDYCFLLGLQNVAKNQASAQTLCGMYNKSVITGVTTLGELNNVKSMMQTNRELLVSKDYLVRVDGKRTTSCQATPATKNCMSSKGFTFSDPLAKTIDSYTWATNSGARATATSDCIVLVLKGNQPIVADVQSRNNPWDKCVEKCGSDDKCVLAHDNNGECQWFEYDGISKVKQTQLVEGTKVAFKVNPISASTCPFGTNPPTFNHQDANGFLLYCTHYANPTGVNYTIIHSEGTWTFTYTAQTACPDDYHVFMECVDINWCFLVVLSEYNISYDESIQKCNEMRRVLSGSGTEYEAECILDWALQIQVDKSVGTQTFLMRVDGMRKSTCQTTPTKNGCTEKEGFNFKDIHGSTLEYYKWATNSGVRAKNGDDCLVVKANGFKNLVMDVQR